jgi:hypothetical protein
MEEEKRTTAKGVSAMLWVLCWRKTRREEQ